MSKQIYEEALADVKKVKEVAEANAQRAIIDAVTPRIRDLIERELLREAGDPEKDDDLDPGGVPPEGELITDLADAAVETRSDAVSEPDEEGKVTLDIDALDSEPEGLEDDPFPPEYELSLESVGSIAPLLKATKVGAAKEFELMVYRLGEAVGRFANAGRLVKESRAFHEKIARMISRVEDMYDYVQESVSDPAKKSSYETKLESYFKELNKLQEQTMSKNKKRMIYEEEDLDLGGDEGGDEASGGDDTVTLKLTGLGGVDLDNVSVDLITGGDAGGDESSGDDESDLGGDEGGDESSGDDDELDLSGDEGGDEGEVDMGEGRRLSDDTIVEIDEGMLRREILRMRRLREGVHRVKFPELGVVSGRLGKQNDQASPHYGNVVLFPDEESIKKAEQLGYDSESLKYDGMSLDDDGVEIMEGKFQNRSIPTVDGHGTGSKEFDDFGDASDEGDPLDVDLVDLSPARAARPLGEADGDDANVVELDELEQADDSREDGGNEAPGSMGPGAGSNAQNRMPESLQRRARFERRLQARAKVKAAGLKREAFRARAARNLRRFNEAKRQYAYVARRFNESVARSKKISRLIAESARSQRGRSLNGSPTRRAESGAVNSLRNKLAETNLINAKLLYTNKLLQNDALTARQKAQVIEQLDSAKTVREAKLVYESLARALFNSSRSLTESRTRGVIGSASRATRPASTQTLNEGYEAERWARLAGIVK